MSETETITAGELLDPLLEAAHPELFRHNAFRVLGLPVTATDRDIKKQAEKIQMMERLGNARGPGAAGPVPLDPPPDSDAIRDAMQRVRNPERRLMDEFFWFWPESGGHDGSPDEASAALARGDRQAALRLWGERLAAGADDGGVALHNLAVLNLVLALDLQHAAQSGGISDKLQNEQTGYWRAGLWRTGQAMSSPQVWERLAGRIRTLDDPRLTEETGRRLLAAVPLALLIINAQIAVRAAERGEVKEVNRQLRLMQDSGLGAELIEEALRRAVEPLRRRVLGLCETARAEADADHAAGAQVARRLLAETKPLLVALDTLLPSGGPLRDDVRDEVSLAALNSATVYGNKTDAWEEVRDLLDQTRPYAVSPSVRQRIAENIEIVKSNAELSVYNRCWFCNENDPEELSRVEVPMYGNVVRTPIYNGTRVTWENLKVPVPRCGRCSDVHRRRDRFTFRGGGVGVLAAVLAWGVMAAVAVSLGATAGCDTLGVALIGAIILFLVGHDIGAQLAKVSSPNVVKDSGYKTSFPQVRKMIGRGWSIGTQP